MTTHVNTEAVENAILAIKNWLKPVCSEYKSVIFIDIDTVDIETDSLIEISVRLCNRHNAFSVGIHHRSDDCRRLRLCGSISYLRNEFILPDEDLPIITEAANSDN